jgi:multicomponent K+:H+ antiporter subunit G
MTLAPGSSGLPVVVEVLVAALVAASGFFAFVGSLGLARLPDTFMRLHGPSKASTLGIGCALVASALYFTATGRSPSVHEFLISAFLAITTPVSAHLLAKAALHRRLAARGNGVHGQSRT